MAGGFQCPPNATCRGVRGQAAPSHPPPFLPTGLCPCTPPVPCPLSHLRPVPAPTLRARSTPGRYWRGATKWRQTLQLKSQPARFSSPLLSRDAPLRPAEGFPLRLWAPRAVSPLAVRTGWPRRAVSPLRAEEGRRCHGDSAAASSPRAGSAPRPGRKMAAAKRSVLSSLAVYAEDSDPESDSEAGTAGSDGGAPTGEGGQGAGTGGGLGHLSAPMWPVPTWRFPLCEGKGPHAAASSFLIVFLFSSTLGEKGGLVSVGYGEDDFSRVEGDEEGYEEEDDENSRQSVSTSLLRELVLTPYTGCKGFSLSNKTPNSDLWWYLEYLIPGVGFSTFHLHLSTVFSSRKHLPWNPSAAWHSSCCSLLCWCRWTLLWEKAITATPNKCYFL